MITVVVEDDKVLRFLQVLLDPATDPERLAVFADYVAHDMAQSAWFDAARPRLAGVFPAAVRLVASREELHAALPAADALVVESFAVGTAELTVAPRLRFIHQFGTRAEGIDLAACAQRGVAVKTQRRRTNVAVAEHTLALILGLARRFGTIANCVTAEQLAARSFDCRPYDTRHTGANNYGRIGGLRVIRGLTLGLLGIGEVAREVVPLARAFGLEVCYHSRQRLAPAAEAALGVRYCDYEALFAQSDIVSLHVPLSAATRGLVGARALAALKPGAWLVNTSRAGLVDHDALVAALASGRLGALAADVHYEEPVGAGERLLAFDNVLATPHIAGGPRQTLFADIEEIAHNIQQALVTQGKSSR